MKKQILFIAVMFSAILFSCTKTSETMPQEQSLESINKPGPPQIDPLSIGLLGRYDFNNNLKDFTGKLADGDPTSDHVLYTRDRKGQPYKAIQFNEAYGVDIFDVPATSEASFSVWVKQEVLPAPFWKLVVSSWKGFTLQQLNNQFNCSYWNGINFQGVDVSPIDNKWHHMAATRDNTSIKFYVDGVLIGSSPTPAGAGPYFPLVNYSLGYGSGTYWRGSMDDLRFYNRVLTPAEVTQLHNL